MPGLLPCQGGLRSSTHALHNNPPATRPRLPVPGLKAVSSAALQRLRQLSRAKSSALRRTALVALPTLVAGLWACRIFVRGTASAPPICPLPRLLPAQRSKNYCAAAMSTRGQDVLVDHLKMEGVVSHPQVERVLRQCDRANYVDGSIPGMLVYQDAPLPIGYHETISAPHMHATCLELLRRHLHPGARVLDVGSGSGYLSAAMGLLVAPTGRVIGVEKHPELAAQSVKNVRRDHPELLESGVVELRAGNVLGDVLEQEEPFDAIHVGAAASSLPEVLVSKLKPGGRMVIPVGPQAEYQIMQCVDKDREGGIKKHDLMPVRYVPLTPPGDTSWEP